MHIADVVFIYQMKTERELDWHGRFHSHEAGHFEFHYFLQGEGSFLNNRVSRTIRKGSLFLCLPGEHHRIQAEDRNRPISYYAVLFSLNDQEGDVRGLLHRCSSQFDGIQIGTTYRFFFEQIKERGMSPSENLRRSAEHQLLSFIYTQAEGADAPQYGDEGNYHIEKALRIMQNMVFDHITLEALAARLRLDPSYVVRLFRKKMNISPMKYYTKLKVEAASSMLINTDQTVGAIAEKLCFSSEFHLSRTFKQHTGLAPSHYRVQYTQHLV